MPVNLPDRAVALIIKNHKILLWWRYSNEKESYSFPGGTLEENETIEETLKREVYEELNLTITAFKKIFTNTHKYKVDDIPDKEFKREEHYFIISDFEGEIKMGDPELSRQSRSNIYRPDWLDKQLFEQQMGKYNPRKIIDLIIEKLA